MGTPRIHFLGLGEIKQAERAGGRKVSHISQELKVAGGEGIVQGNKNIFGSRKSKLIFLPMWWGEGSDCGAVGTSLADTHSLVLTLQGH